jgi:antitoxin component YwqK of YwqJK toxin-antitoxin module|tara:strand:- start:62 stop:970 length:909 start_codon:yes stop_codon:yes gene_type:complete
MGIFDFLIKREEKKLQRETQRGIQNLRRTREEMRNLGPFEHYHENGEIKVKGTMKNGSLVGPWEFYYENGQLEIRGVCEGDGIKQQGLWETFYENGQPKIIEHFKSGKRHGLIEEFDKNGQLIHRGNYQHGIPEGCGEYYGKNGKKVTNKPFKSYYHRRGDSNSKGLLCENGEIKNGKEHGLWKIYWDMEKVKSSGYLTSKKYQIQFKGMFKEGKKTGEWIVYHQEGHVCERTNYKNGKKEGLHQYLHSDGEVFLTKEYKDGESIEIPKDDIQKILDDTKKLTKEIEEGRKRTKELLKKYKD